MLIPEEDRKVLRSEFEKLTKPVKLLFFSQRLDCEYCRDTKLILDELTSLSDKITVEEIPLLIEQKKAAKYGIDKAPAIVVTDDAASPSGVVFYGIPAGYEFVSLLGAIKDRGVGQTELSGPVLEEVRKIDKPVTLRVFVTPTCPYCPRSVRIAHQMAFENPNIRGEMIEASEFPDVARRYQVMGVPRTVINEDVSLEGAHPEHSVLDGVLRALGATETITAGVN
jgi:glutaredoxin-like protein